MINLRPVFIKIMNIEQFEKEFYKKFNNYAKVWNKEERILHLFEEIGEFAEIILQYNGSKKPQKNICDIKIALADILEDVLALSILYNIDIVDLIKELINEKSS